MLRHDGIEKKKQNSLKKSANLLKMLMKNVFISRYTRALWNMVIKSLTILTVNNERKLF